LAPAFGRGQPAPGAAAIGRDLHGRAACRRVVAGAGAGLMAGSPDRPASRWPRSPGGRQWNDRRSRRPCHPRAISSGHERYPAVSHGQFEEAGGLGAPPLTWGGGGGRNCMACKGSGVQIPSAPPQVRGPFRPERSRIPALAQQIRSNRAHVRPRPAENGAVERYGAATEGGRCRLQPTWPGSATGKLGLNSCSWHTRLWAVAAQVAPGTLNS
jgi:hypothetical protein